MFYEIIEVFTKSFFWSTLLIGFFIVKGGFEKKYLFTDNVLLSAIATILLIVINKKSSVNHIVQFIIITPVIIFVLFILLFIFRFYRNPNRKAVCDENDILSPADGRVIYIRTVDKGSYPVSLKKKNMIRLDEITKTEMLKEPCYLIGIAMTLFDVHYNRSPIDGKVRMIKHTDGKALGLKNPESTFINERNTFIIENDKYGLFGVIQIAARGVRRCLSTVKENDSVIKGQIIGKIRFGSQVDIIIPRKNNIHVREGDQVYAGLSILATSDEGIEGR